MNYQHQMTRLVALGCLAWGVTSWIPTQVNLVTAQIPENADKLLLAQNRQRAANDFFTADLTGCTRQGRTVRCDLLFISNDDNEGTVHCYESKIYDYSGNSHLCSKVKVGNNAGDSFASDRFPQGIPLKVTLWFNEIPESSNDFSLLEISNQRDASVKKFLKFPNVQVSR